MWPRYQTLAELDERQKLKHVPLLRRECFEKHYIPWYPMQNFPNRLTQRIHRVEVIQDCCAKFESRDCARLGVFCEGIAARLLVKAFL